MADALSPGRMTYTMLYMGLIVFFAYFYTAIVFNPVDLADNMKKYGGFIPGRAAGQEDGRVHRPRADPHHAAGRPVPGPDLRAARPADPLVQRAVLLRRDQPADRRRRGAGHRAPDGIAPAHAQLRGLPQAVQVRGRAPSPGGAERCG